MSSSSRPARFINQTKPDQEKRRRGRPGAPKIAWTPKRLRHILWLYAMTPLSIKKITRIIDEGSEYHPQESSVVGQLVTLFGPDYANYKIRCHPASLPGKGAANLERLKVRLRCVKNSEHTLAKYLKFMQETHDDLESTIDMDFMHSSDGDGSSSSMEEHPFPMESLTMPLDSSHSSITPDFGAENEVSTTLTLGEHRMGKECSNLTISHVTNTSIAAERIDRTWLRNRFSKCSIPSDFVSLIASVDRLSLSTYTPSVLSTNENQSSSVLKADTTTRRNVKATLRRLYPSLGVATLSKEEHEIWNELIDIDATSEPFQRYCSLWQRRQGCCDFGKWPENPSWESRLCTDDGHYDRIPSLNEFRVIFCGTCKIRGIHIAAARGSYGILNETARDFLRIPDRWGNRAIHFAATSLTALRWSLESLLTYTIQRVGEEEVTAVNQEGQTFLHFINFVALHHFYYLWDEISAIARTIKKVCPKFDFNRQDCHGKTFWHCICMALQQAEILSDSDLAVSPAFLRAINATNLDPLIPDNHGRTVAGYLPETFRHLLAGSDRGRATTWLKTIEPLQFSANIKHRLIQIVQSLNQKQLTAYDFDGDTLLTAFVKNPHSLKRYSAVGRQQEEAVNYILHQGVPLEARDRSGETAMYIATRLGQPNVVRALLRSGADYTIQNYAGISLIASARDSILEERKRGTFESVKEEANLLACIFTLLDHDWGDPLPQNHRYSALNPRSSVPIEGVLLNGSPMEAS